MTVAIKSLLAPYQPLRALVEAPPRRPFSKLNFKTFAGAIRLVRSVRRDKAAREAELCYNDALKAHGLGRFPAAEQLYFRCIQLQPDHEPGHTNLAALYLHQNSFDLAEAQLKEAIRARPLHYRPHYNLGLLFQCLEQVEPAIQAFQKALTLRKDHFWSLVALGELYAGEQN